MRPARGRRLVAGSLLLSVWTLAACEDPSRKGTDPSDAARVSDAGQDARDARVGERPSTDDAATSTGGSAGAVPSSAKIDAGPPTPGAEPDAVAAADSLDAALPDGTESSHDAARPDADVGSSPFVDSGVPTPPLDCRSASPALAFDVVAMVQGPDLVLRALDSGEEQVVLSWSADFRPSRPVTFTAAAGQPAFALSLANGSVCRVEAVGKDGTRLWAVERDASRCAPLTPSEGGLWFPLGLADSTGVLERLDASDGAALSRSVLPSAPTTALAALGGGGSHWVGGSDRGLLVVVAAGSDAPSLVLHELDEFAPVLDVAPYASDRVVVAAERALGRFRVDLDGEGLEPLGATISTEGSIASNLVASLDCGDRAGGATHYFCEAGLLSAGGTGWWSAWRLDDGAPWFELSVEDTVQGLALLADGSLHSGGSHWFGGEGDISIHSIAEPTAPVELVHSTRVTTESCAGSPVVDTDGTLGLAVASREGGELLTVETRAAGLATGWSRAAGENGSRGALTNQQSSCEAGSVRLFQRSVGPELARASDLAVLPDGSFAIAGTGDGALLAGFSANGLQEWSRPLSPPATQAERVVSAGDQLFAFTLLPDSIAITVLDPGGELLFERSEPSNGLSRLIGAHALDDGRVILVAALTAGDPLATDARIFVIDVDGAVAAQGELLDAALLIPSASAVVPGTSDLVLTGSLNGAGGFVARVDLDGNLSWFDAVATARADLTGSAVLADADGVATVAFTNGPHTLLHRYDATGLRVLTTPTSFVVPAALAAGPFGTWLLDQNGGVARVLDQLTLAPLRAPPESPFLNALALEATAFGTLLVANATEADGSGTVFLAHLDEAGRSGCARAGLCVSSDGCPDDGACLAGSCDPSTGACSTEAAPELSSCGENDVCYQGACGSVPDGVDAPRTVEASACYDVASFAECVPFALVYATIILEVDGTIDTMDPMTTGTWREPAGPGSIEFVFRNANDGSVASTFTGQLSFDRCWEGTILLAGTGTGAFRACGT